VPAPTTAAPPRRPRDHRPGCGGCAWKIPRAGAVQSWPAGLSERSLRWFVSNAVGPGASRLAGGDYARRQHAIALRHWQRPCRSPRQVRGHDAVQAERAALVGVGIGSSPVTRSTAFERAAASELRADSSRTFRDLASRVGIRARSRPDDYARW
jgi:hypothetical protein